MTSYNDLPCDVIEYIHSFHDTPRQNYDTMIRHIQTISRIHKQIEAACLDIIFWNMDDGYLKPIYDVSYITNKLNIKGMERRGWTDSHSSFMLKYYLKPHKYILKSIKTKTLSFWK